MVRKWSYLNIKNLHNSSGFKPLLKKKSFKVFKYTTKFKKYNLGITRSVRQKYSQRKFYTSYLVLSQITKYWSLNYIQSKQIERFIQSMYYAPIISHSPNIDIFNSVNKNNEKNLNFHLFSCSTKLLYRFYNVNNYKKTLLTPIGIKNTKLSFTQSSSFDSLLQNDVTYPLNTYFDKLQYHPHLNPIPQNYTLTLNQVTQSLLTINLNLIVSYYKTFILLTWINLSRN